LKATLVGVLAQRLVRSLCADCKAPVEAPPDAQWEALTRPYRARRPQTVWKAAGCIACRNTGYAGRAGLYELLEMTEAVRDCVTDTPELRPLREVAMREGMRPLRVSGALKVAAGQTTVEEVLRTAPAAER
jgi:general secretion pathway protein E